MANVTKSIAAGLLALLASCSSFMTSETQTLIGDWGLRGVKTLTFTDNLLIQYFEGKTYRYGYTDFGNGVAEYHLLETPEYQVTMSYSYSGNTMHLSIQQTVGSTYTRM